MSLKVSQFNEVIHLTHIVVELFINCSFENNSGPVFKHNASVSVISYYS